MHNYLMDILYVVMVLFGSFWQSFSPHIPVVLLVLGAFFTGKALLSLRRGKKNPGFLLAGLALLGFGLCFSWPEGRYTAQEGTTWFTLKGTIPADAKLVCESRYYSVTNAYECTTSPPLIDLNPNGSSNARRTKRISYKEDIAFNDGTYMVRVPEKAVLGSCEYRLSRLLFFDKGRWLFDASSTKRNDSRAIYTEEPINMMCREGSTHPGETSPQMYCSSDLQKQPWSSYERASLWLYRPSDKDDITQTVNIRFETPRRSAPRPARQTNE